MTIPPETHKRVHGRIHGEKVGIDDRDGNFPDMGAGSTAEERGLRVAEIPLLEIGCRSRTGAMPILRRCAFPSDAGE